MSLPIMNLILITYTPSFAPLKSLLEDIVVHFLYLPYTLRPSLGQISFPSFVPEYKQSVTE